MFPSEEGLILPLKYGTPVVAKWLDLATSSATPRVAAKVNTRPKGGICSFKETYFRKERLCYNLLHKSFKGAA